jgi:hypothetical protein
MKLCSPEAQQQPISVKAVRRPETLNGLRIGFLDNTKPPADRIMAHLDAKLRERFPEAKTFHIAKHASSQGAKPEILQALKDNADVVITGLGD